MKIIVGHTNMDLDCIGSMALVRHLHPGHVPIRSHLIHPVARNLYNLYEKQLRFMEARELKGRQVDQVVVVDARARARIKEYLEFIPGFQGPYQIYDHHTEDSSDLTDSTIHECVCGANTTLIGLELLSRDIRVPAEDATIALIGMYADTGRFTHTNVQASDFDVASYLLSCGASLKVVDRLLRSLRDEAQVNQFHRMLNNLIHRNVNGHSILLCYLELDRRVSGLSAVVEKVFETENPDALFAVFGLEKQNQSLIIARTNHDGIDLTRLLEPYGGGGHPQASSALLKGDMGKHIVSALGTYLDSALAPAAKACDIMSPQVRAVGEDWDLMKASLFLEEINHGGAPVVSTDGRLAGFLTLRDIMKGRRAGEMHAPVRGYMTRRVITAGPGDTISEIENLMFRNGIGHVPIVEDGLIRGLVTRTDFLRFVQASREEKRRAYQEATREQSRRHRPMSPSAAKPQKNRIHAIIEILARDYPDAVTPLRHENPFQLLVATILSAQCTDERVNQVTPELFSRYPDPASLSKARLPTVEKLIHSTGFFRNKARSLKGAAGRIVTQFSGAVPAEMEDLISLPGVGRKTANVIRGACFGRPSVVVDTHLGRVVRRLGLTTATDPVKVETEIRLLVPEGEQTQFSMTANFHGRRVCHSRKPNCQACALASLCPYPDQ